MSFIFGGGGGGQSTTGTQTVTQREAPEIEARKLSLYDLHQLIYQLFKLHLFQV